MRAPPAAAAGIALPRIRESGRDADPAWLVFDALPGVPVPEAGDAAPESSRASSSSSDGMWPFSIGCAISVSPIVPSPRVSTPRNASPPSDSRGARG
jgi:hypothetical protein